MTSIALCGARTPHFTAIAAFASTLGPDVAHVFPRCWPCAIDRA